jgi:hypothetical protein
MSRLGLPLNCPYCGQRMAHVWRAEDWHFFECEACGPITMPPNGRIRRSTTSDYVVIKLDDRKHGS